MRVLSVAWFFLWLPLAVLGMEQAIEKAMTADEFRATGLDKLTPEELSRFNAWLTRNSTTTVVAPVADRDLPEAVTVSVSRVDMGPTLAPRYRKAAGFSEPDRVESHIVGKFSGWNKDSVFDLGNGQSWQVTDASSYSTSTKTNPEVQIKKALMGSWLMKVGGGNRSTRVERIR